MTTSLISRVPSHHSSLEYSSPSMAFLRRLSRKHSALSSPTTENRSPVLSSPAVSPLARTTPTRRPNYRNSVEPPPAYTPAGTNSHTSTSTVVDSPYTFLTQFDTVFLIDDSGSMAGRSWRETSAALAAITPICTSHDADGIDIYFLNHRSSASGALARSESDLGGYEKVTSDHTVQNIFNTVRPGGGTPTGTRINQILKPYLSQLERGKEVKPLNIIVITDGVPSDDVESVIVAAARRLDKLDAEPWQIGIQFFQVGREPEAAEDLRELDDALSDMHNIRDIVDTVPWTGDDGYTLTADGLLKVVLGSVNKRLDRRRGNDERLRGGPRAELGS